MTIEFEDADELDAISDEDVDVYEIDWDRVVALKDAFDAVLAIEDDDERLEAAKALVAEISRGQ